MMFQVDGDRRYGWREATEDVDLRRLRYASCLVVDGIQEH